MADNQEQVCVFDCTHGWAPNDLDEVVSRVCSGELLVLPTDTVYGVGCRADDAQAVGRLLNAKGRTAQKPPPVLVSAAGDIDRLCDEVPDDARTLASQHWPGGLTLVLKAREDLGWDLGQTEGTLALRMPDHPVALTLLERTGPLAVTSANLTGCPPAMCVTEAVDALAARVNLYIDGGPTVGLTPSTILDVSHGKIRPLRQGAISLEELSATVGYPIVDDRSPRNA